MTQKNPTKKKRRQRDLCIAPKLCQAWATSECFSKQEPLSLQQKTHYIYPAEVQDTPNWIIIHVLINWPLIFVKCRGRRSAIQCSQESKYIRTGDQKHVFWRGSSKICHLNVKNKYCNDKKALAAIFSPCIVILGSQLRRFFFLFDYSNFFSSGSILEYIKRRFRSLYKSNKLVIGLMKYKWTPSNTIPQFII